MEETKPKKEFLINNEQAQLIREKIYKLIQVENILNLVDPRLKQIYLAKANKDEENSNTQRGDIPYLQLFKISIPRMNNEERMLLAFLTPKNLDTDLPDLLSYIALIQTKVELVNKSNKDYILGHSEEILNFVIKEATEHYLSSKLKVYITEEDDEKDVPVEKMSEEETRKQVDEILSHPLFMTEIPKDIKDNPYLEGIQAIKYAEEPEEIGKQSLSDSKEKFHSYKEKKQFKLLKESIIEVTNAIDHCIEDNTVLADTKRKLLIQRADINIHVKNWNHALDDLIKALEYSYDSIENLEHTVNNIIFCYINIKAFVKAETFITQQLTKIPKFLYDDYKIFYVSKLRGIHSMKEEHYKQMQEIEVFKQMGKSEQHVVLEDLALKGVRLMPQYHKVPQNFEARIFKDEEGLYHFPLLIVYEEFNMTDYIQDCHEDTTVEELIAMLLKESLPWDKEKLYTLKSLQGFYEMNLKDYNLHSLTTSYFPLKSTDTIKSIITNKSLFMNGFPVISFISRNSRFFDHFLKNKIILKRK